MKSLVEELKLVAVSSRERLRIVKIAFPADFTRACSKKVGCVIDGHCQIHTFPQLPITTDTGPQLGSSGHGAIEELGYMRSQRNGVS